MTILGDWKAVWTTGVVDDGAEILATRGERAAALDALMALRAPCGAVTVYIGGVDVSKDTSRINELMAAAEEAAR